MTFRAQRPDLVERQLSNMDEQIKLRAAQRTHYLSSEAHRAQAQACHARALELQRENEEIARQLRDAKSNVRFAKFGTEIRPDHGFGVVAPERLSLFHPWGVGHPQATTIRHGRST